MLCTMCMFGVRASHCWRCPCGEFHCRHILDCPTCGTRKYDAEKE